MAQVSQPTQFINYVSEFKKILVTRQNKPISVKFKIDNRINDTYYFQQINANNQIVDLSGFNYQFFGSYIDAKQYEHVLFFTDNFTITSGNILSFKVNTYTSEYVNYVKVPKQIDIAIRKKADGINQVILRDTGIAYPTPVYEGEQPGPTVAGFGLWKNGYVMSLTGTVLSGDNSTIAINDNTISLIAPIPSAVSQLVNDVPYVTSSDSNYIISAVDGGGYPRLKFQGTGQYDYFKVSLFLNDANYVNWNNVQDMLELYGYLTAVPSTYALKTDIPTNISQLTNDEGFITGYIAGSGISIDNGVISCTGGGGGGATYTAGEGIGIDSNNVISLTATIPSAVSQLTNDAGYITHVTLTGYGYVNGYYNFTTQNYGLKYNGTVVNVSWLPNDAGYITNAALTNYATKTELDTVSSAIPTDYATTGQLEAVSAAIPSQEMLENVITGIGYYNDAYTYRDENDPHFYWIGTSNYGYATERWVRENYAEKKDVTNKDRILIDSTVHSSDFSLAYNKNYDIFVNTIETVDGELNINPIKGYGSDLEVGDVTTFEHWIIPSGTLTGITIADGIQLIGQLPSSYTSGFTQVFTRRIFKKSSKPAIQQISYAYQFNDTIIIPSSVVPLTFKGVESSNTIQVNDNNNTNDITLQYSKNGGAWTAYTIGDQITLSQDETVAFSGNNDHFNDWNRDFSFVCSDGKVDVYGTLMSLVGYNQGITSECEFRSLFNNNTSIRNVSGLILPQNTSNYCYMNMFQGCTSLTDAPKLPAKTIGNCACYEMFNGCSSLTSNIVIEAETIQNQGCNGMFKNCSLLTNVEIKAEDDVYGDALSFMFNNCSSLSSITVHLTTWYPHDSNVTYDWIVGVAANGTFTKPSVLGEEYDNDKIPQDWNVVNI